MCDSVSSYTSLCHHHFANFPNGPCFLPLSLGLCMCCSFWMCSSLMSPLPHSLPPDPFTSCSAELNRCLWGLLPHSSASSQSESAAFSTVWAPPALAVALLDFNCWFPCLMDADYKLLRPGTAPFTSMPTLSTIPDTIQTLKFIGRKILIILLITHLHPSR